MLENILSNYEVTGPWLNRSYETTDPTNLDKLNFVT